MKTPEELRLSVFREYGAAGGRFDRMPTDAELKAYGLACYRLALADAKPRRRFSPVGPVVMEVDLNDLDAIAEAAEKLP